MNLNLHVIKPWWGLYGNIISEFEKATQVKFVKTLNYGYNYNGSPATYFFMALFALISEELSLIFFGAKFQIFLALYQWRKLNTY